MHEGPGGDLAREGGGHPRVSRKGSPEMLIQVRGDAELDF